MPDYTTTGLIEQVKVRASVPTSQTLFTESRLLGLLNDELLTFIVPFIMSVREEFFVVYRDGAIIDGQREYEIPARAIGNKLREVTLVSNGQEYGRLVRYQPERVIGIAGLPMNNGIPFNTSGYIMRNNSVYLIGPITGGGTLRMYYFRRPGYLVATGDCAEVVSVDTNTNTITCASVPPSWATGTSIDCVQGLPPFDNTFEASSIVSVAGNDVVVSDASEVVAGDWLALEGNSPIAQIPYDLQQLLVQAAAVRVLETLGDEKIQIAQAKLEGMKNGCLSMIANRVESEAKKVVPRHIGFGGNMTSRYRW